jgi:hypothetical protein
MKALPVRTISRVRPIGVAGVEAMKQLTMRFVPPLALVSAVATACAMQASASSLGGPVDAKGKVVPTDAGGDVLMPCQRKNGRRSCRTVISVTVGVTGPIFRTSRQHMDAPLKAYTPKAVKVTIEGRRYILPYVQSILPEFFFPYVLERKSGAIASTYYDRRKVEALIEFTNAYGTHSFKETLKVQRRY